MNPVLGWALVALALAVGWLAYGAPGLLLAVTLTVFWLLLQVSRTLRVMRGVSGAPVGHVESAVMLNAKLGPGLQMLQVLQLTKSLGRRVGEGADVFAWSDAGGAEVVVTFERGRTRSWVLNRPPEAAG